ncbi:transketolase [Lachnospiraceae bacterium ZAX-1]
MNRKNDMVDDKKAYQSSKEIRKEIFLVSHKAKGAHLGGCFSCVEILNALYLQGHLKIDAKNPYDENRDRFVLSKGHAGLALYAVLYKMGFLSKEKLYCYCMDGGNLGTHPKKNEIPGIEASTGSLGHGLSYSIGLALGAKYKKKDFNVYCLLGDGECQEGSIWEGMLSAPQLKLNNLTVIIDYNKMQAMDYLDNIIALTPLKEKCRAFNWDTYEVDGHNIGELMEALCMPTSTRPKMIIANTVKGKGISFMEGEPLWHFRAPNLQELEIVKKELNITDEELTLG